MTQLEIKGELLISAGKREGLEYALECIRYLPMNQLVRKIQERIDSCEDQEFALSRQLEVEPLTSNPPAESL